MDLTKVIAYWSRLEIYPADNGTGNFPENPDWNLWAEVYYPRPCNEEDYQNFDPKWMEDLGS